jgi:hypothetical protein
MDVSQLATKAVARKVPKSVDGRSYPKHLERYHVYDERLLPLVARLAPATYDQLAVHVTDSRTLAALSRWLNSAEWRGPVVRASKDPRARRAYLLGPNAPQDVRHAA